MFFMKLIVTTILTFMFGQVLACVCKDRTVKEVFDSSPIIFHGRVIDVSVALYSTTLRDEQLKVIREKFTNDKKRLEELEYDKIRKVIFQVIEIIKGDSVTNTITIFTSQNTSCDIDFKKGGDYIVYGARWGFNYNKYWKHRDINYEFIKDGLYWTDYCSRTQLFNERERQSLIELKNG
jgi:hypothetical protein